MRGTICATVAGLLALIAATPTIAQEVPASPLSYTPELLEKGASGDPAAAYANDFKVSRTSAKENLKLQDEAVAFATQLQASNPAGFVDVAIRHGPSFKVILFYNKDIDRAALTRSAPVDLRRYLFFNPLTRSKVELMEGRKALHRALSGLNRPFGLEFDYDTDRYVLQIPQEADEATYTSVIPASLRSEVEIRRAQVRLMWSRFMAAGGLQRAAIVPLAGPLETVPAGKAF